MTRKTRDLTRTGLVVLGAALALTALTESAYAWRGCWGCGAYVGPVVVARPYIPPVYYSAPVVVAPPVYAAPPVAVAPVYPVCPALPPYPYYCR